MAHHDGLPYQEYPPLPQQITGTIEERVAVEFVSVPIPHVIRLAQIFVGKLETEPTQNNCLCMWIIHPEDMEKPFEEARKRRGNAHPMCPIHTKEGLIGGFLKFVLKHPEVCLACPWGCNSCTKDVDCECYEHQDLHPDNPTDDEMSDIDAANSFEEAMKDEPSE